MDKVGNCSPDVQNVAVMLFTGELTVPEAFEEVKTVVTATASVFLENAMKIGTEAVATVMKVKIPILAPIIDTAKVWVQRYIPQIAKKTVETVKEFGKKAINWIFG